MNEEVLLTKKEEIILPNTALCLEATKTFVDAKGVTRYEGDRWLIREQGSYMPCVFEKVVEHVKGTTITDTVALLMRALDNFTDVYGVERYAGEMWLITNKMG